MSLYERRKQQQDLARLHEECELNYGRLRRIISDGCTLGARFSLQYKDSPRSGINLQVIEVTRYTSTLLITADRAGPRWLPKIEIKVRVYRDARMAEVIEWCDDRTIPWVLSETKGMQARDEKWQWNIFLSELLSLGLRHGMIELEA
ncbi:MAG: DUF1249 domain-containing protein [Porticoccaceae bacterium]